MSTYKMAVAEAAGTGDGLAQLDIQFDGVLTAVDWAACFHLDAADEQGTCELSFLSANQIGNNDARGSISMIRQRLTSLTAEAGPLGVNKSVTGLEIPVTRGERVYLHLTGVVAVVDCYLHVSDRSDPRLRRRR